MEIAIEKDALDRARADAVARACPVDIFRVDEAGGLATHPEREDECILCGRCVQIAAEAVSVRRTYGERRPVIGAVDG